MKKAVVLFSSGLDSTTVLYYALSKGYDCNCLTFDYGQKHRKEIESAIAIAKDLKVEATVMKIALPWAKDSLTNKDVEVPVDRQDLTGIPSTYVPGRNTLFLSYALSFAQSIKAQKIFIGANSLDYSGYPDCRPQFIEAYNALIDSLDTNVEVLAPLIKMTKAQIIKLGIRLKVPYEKTWSCYKGKSEPCGKCDSCLLRAKGFLEAGKKDPLLAVKVSKK
ncbi:MAG: 7-cyano-7-deazaguanine synthase QueC [Elusimicrobiota bacterium]|jgi:7-cyano-7-deazaguanine synthase|nr:7-cyano-7-deazaguanine synthase QueC [Elusimicrobiota bacterium]